MRPDIVFTIRRVHSRFLRLHVHQDGLVVVTAPKRVGRMEIDQFVASKKDWIAQKQRELAQKPKSILHTANAADYQKYKRAAMTLAAKQLQHFNVHYGFTYRRLSIRNSKTRWGSCSRQGSISVSYTIALLPPALADYILVHELCHCKEFNHSVRFWKLISETIPDFRERKSLLKRL